MIPYGRQTISTGDIEAVVDVLRSDFLTQGPAIPRFEGAVAEYCAVPHAVAVNSATSALHIACLALDVGPGDRVWTSPITFVASANCALYCGAQIDFVDIDPATANMSVERLAEKLADARRSGALPKVVIPVHLCGQSCNMAAIQSLAQEYGFRVIEDASHAIGGKYRQEPIGICRYSDITIFSFHPVKIVTSAEGGMALTRNAALAKRLQLLRNHGISRDASDMTHEPDGAWYYQQIALGFNYRITDLQAALGWSQLRRLDGFVKRRHEIAGQYDERLLKAPLRPLQQHPDAYSALHLYVVRLDLSDGRRSHRVVFDSLRAAGIGVNVHYIPVHLQPYYEKLGFRAGTFPAAEQYYREAITLPMYPALTDDQQDTVVKAVFKALAA